MYNYKLYAYNGSDYCQVILDIKANNETEAIDTAKKLVKRDVYIVERVKKG